MRALQIILALFAAAFAVVVFILSVVETDHLPRRREVENMRVRMPIALQLAATTGDRYLATNVDVFRAEMVGTQNLDPETMHVLAALQTDAVLMNPFHEDNYYLAAGVLAWGGEVDSGIEILSRTTAARTFDPMPPFFLGFTYQYFNGDFKTGAKWVGVAAERSTDGNRNFFHGVAVRWLAQIENPYEAIAVLKALGVQSRDPDYRHFIALRIERVEGLIALKKADAAYRKQNGRAAHGLADLVGYGGLTQLPVDPTGTGYQMNARDEPSLASPSVRAAGMAIK